MIVLSYALFYWLIYTVWLISYIKFIAMMIWQNNFSLANSTERCLYYNMQILMLARDMEVQCTRGGPRRHMVAIAHAQRRTVEALHESHNMGSGFAEREDYSVRPVYNHNKNYNY